MKKKSILAVILVLAAMLSLPDNSIAKKKKKSKETFSAQAKSGVIPAWEKGYLEMD